jgi:hypothetical protein
MRGFEPLLCPNLQRIGTMPIMPITSLVRVLMHEAAAKITE